MELLKLREKRCLSIVNDVEKECVDILFGKKLSDKTRKQQVVLFRSTLAYIFYNDLGLNYEQIANIFDRDRTSIYKMITATENNLFQFAKKDCFNKDVICYLYEKCNLNNPFINTK